MPKIGRIELIILLQIKTKAPFRGLKLMSGAGNPAQLAPLVCGAQGGKVSLPPLKEIAPPARGEAFSFGAGKGN